MIKQIKKSFSILALNKNAINNVANNGSTWLAVILFGFWSLIAGIALFDTMSAIGWFVEAILLTYIVASIMYLVALFFKSKTNFTNLYRPWGYAQLIVGISFLINKLSTTKIALIIALLLEIWCMTVAYKIIRTQFHLKPWKALVAVLTPILILVIIVMTNATTLLNIIIESGLVSGLLF